MALYYIPFGVAVLSDMFNKKVKIIIGVNSVSMRAGTLFTLVNAEFFENTLE